jgi:penicillin-binding protein 1A
MNPIKQGLCLAINALTARFMKEVGPEAVVKKAREMGITSPIKAYPSIALGTMDISVYEMVSAFNTFANKGVWTEPTIVTRIEDKNGNVLEKFVPKSREVLSKTTNYIMLDMLKNVTNNGTSVRLRYKYGFDNPIAAKTGTTQNQTDGWFLGAVPDLTAGVWVGGDNRKIRFRNISLGQGANMALPIWAKFMKRCYADSSLQVSKGEFEKPDQPLPVETDCAEKEYEGETEPAEELEF